MLLLKLRVTFGLVEVVFVFGVGETAQATAFLMDWGRRMAGCVGLWLLIFARSRVCNYAGSRVVLSNRNGTAMLACQFVWQHQGLNYPGEDMAKA